MPVTADRTTAESPLAAPTPRKNNIGRLRVPTLTPTPSTTAMLAATTAPVKANISTKGFKVKPPLSQDMMRLRACKTFECLQEFYKDTHPDGEKPKYKFNYPHFMITGWQKSATTSLFSYLMQHPQVAKPFYKEPHYFTSCFRAGPACKARTGDLLDPAWYIRDAFQVELITSTNLKIAAMEASADYAQGGERIALLLKERMPWLKLVFALREPISRAISWRTMMGDKFGKGCNDPKRYKSCLEFTLSSRNYSEPLEGWLKVWPKDQLKIVQFEALVKDPDPILKEIKRFLDLDPKLPEAHALETGFSNVNGRGSFGKGLPMSKAEYKELLEPQRRDAKEIVKLLDKYKIKVPGLKNTDEWMANWDEIWQGNYDSCKDGTCGVRG